MRSPRLAPEKPPADPLREKLSGLRVVLVEPQHPGNIGACARVMTNMGLRDLVLVSPACELGGEALAMAAGAAERVRQARVVGSLAEAVADAQVVVGTTARARHLRWQVQGASAFAADLPPLLAAGQRVALLFGPERTGLLNEHLEYCTRLVTVDTNPEYPSLNLASAVQVLSFAVREAMRAACEKPVAPAGVDLPPREHIEAWLRAVAVALDRIGFVERRGDLDQTMRRLRALVGRASPDRRELQLLHGIVAKAMKRADAGDGPD